MLQDRLAGLGRHWGWAFAFGAVTTITGLLALVWPGRTVIVMAVLFGIQLVAAGIFRFTAAFAVHGASGAARALYALVGALSFGVGLFAVRHVAITVATLAVLLGIYWIVSGTVELFTAVSERGTSSVGWGVTIGLLGIVAGVITLAYPGLTLVTLVAILGAWLMVLGVLVAANALRLRSLNHKRAAQLAAA